LHSGRVISQHPAGSFKTGGWIFLFLFLPVILGAYGCDKIPFLQGMFKKQAAQKAPFNAVARIGSFYITQDDLDTEIKSFNEQAAAQKMPQNKIDTREKKLAYLKNDLVRRYMLYQEALDRGLENRNDVARALRDGKILLLVSELLREETQNLEVSSKEIENFYNQNKDLLKEPEQRRLFEIVTPTEAEAKQVYIELLKGTDFSAMARQYSKAKSASNGGDLGFISLEIDPQKRPKFDQFYEVAFSPTLEAGSISNIFKGPDGYYIIKLGSIKKSEAKPLSELWDNIKSYLLYQKQQKAIEDLANKLSGEIKVDVYDDKVE